MHTIKENLIVNLRDNWRRWHFSVPPCWWQKGHLPEAVNIHNHSLQEEESCFTKRWKNKGSCDLMKALDCCYLPSRPCFSSENHLVCLLQVPWFWHNVIRNRLRIFNASRSNRQKKMYKCTGLLHGMKYQYRGSDSCKKQTFLRCRTELLCPGGISSAIFFCLGRGARTRIPKLKQQILLQKLSKTHEGLHFPGVKDRTSHW